ncbi:MAG: protease inhibitor I42 family protein [Alphaproteobacteria bacterium]|nr:protease inhibitor I42 family protein [Alphaproteobacteria bacterium]
MTDIKKMAGIVKVGEVFRVTFNEASGGGYLWSVAPREDMTINKSTTDKSARGAIGGHVQAVFSGIVAKEGVYEIEFTHKRPWEDKAEEVVQYTLTVKP